MFEFLKKSPNKKNTVKNKSVETVSIDTPGEVVEEKLLQENEDNIKTTKAERKLTFHEEQYLRVQKSMEEKESAAFEEFKRSRETNRYDLQKQSKAAFISGLAALYKVITVLTNICPRTPLFNFWSWTAGVLFVVSLVIYLWSRINY